MAIRLFQKPRHGAIPEKQSQYLKAHAFTSFISNNTTIQAYRWPGSGKRILLLHGWESNTARWKIYMEQFKKRNFDVYAIDAPAHGLSGGDVFSPELYADAVQDFIDKNPCNILIGHSVGAYTALLYARRSKKPENLSHLILLAPTGRLGDFMDRYFSILGLRKAIRKYYFDNFESMYGRKIEYYDSDNLVQNLDLPGLLIHDKNDETLPFKDSQDIAHKWTQGLFIPTEGFGHRLKSTEVTRHMLNYIDTEILN